MSAAQFINFNGTVLPSGMQVLTADNRGFRYGDGIFETMAVKNSRIRLWDHHFERLTNGARLLHFESFSSFTSAQLSGEISALCEKNGHSVCARVRLVLFRGDMDTGDIFPNYIIQTAALSADNDAFNGTGLSIDLFPDGRKSCDLLSHLKSNNYLLYSLAASYAKRQGKDDCLVLNNEGRIADSSIANLFYVKENRVYTPPLSEGCVAGVMRRFLLEMLPAAGFDCLERPVTIEDLRQADEVFLTNALKGIKWVGSFGQKSYTNSRTTALYQEVLKKF